jgi:type I restriction enzyme, S subunit
METIPFADFAQATPKISLQKKELFPYVDIAAITPGHRYVKALQERSYKGGGSKFQTGDTLFARITPCLENGKIAQFIGPASDTVGFGSTEFFVFRARDGVSDPSYLFYLCRTDALRKPAEKSMAGASGRQRADLNSILSVEVCRPPLPTQRKIASILSAYDDLIENNTRRIAILEEMAQSIYREWFVNFRFPGFEDVKLVDSPLGMIPEGWEVVSTRDAIDIKPRTHVPKEGEKPFVSMGAVPTNTMLIDEAEIESRTKNSGSKFKNGDTLFARITPCLENGKTAFVNFLPSDEGVACGSTEFIVLRSETVIPEFVYLLARSDEFRDIAIKSMSGATGRQRVREACFDQFYFAHPTATLLEQFQDVANPLFRSVFTLAKKNNNLRTTRNLLLPKLISGKLDVEDLDIDVIKPLEELQETTA